MGDTIAAISTPLGTGGVAMIRISGPEAFTVADGVIATAGGKKAAEREGYTCAYGRIYDEDGEFDEGILTVFHGPHSYTGEDVAEICGHGGVYLAGRILRACMTRGARMAQPGEFTRRAFLNGKMDLTKAEAVADLIHAQGRQAARAALSARDGALYQKLCLLEKKLLSCAAALAAWIDYPEEDIGAVDEGQLKTELSFCMAELQRLLDTYDQGKLLREGIETVIAGKPNTGKSTLMNLLSGEERSIVADLPGTTRDVVSDQVRLGDLVLLLSDTAGIRLTQDAVEQAGVTMAKGRLRRAQLVLAVFDGSRVLEEDDLAVIKACQDVPSIAVINKTDLPEEIEIRRIQEAFAHVVFISAKDGRGLLDLQRCIEKVFQMERLDLSAAMVANERQRRGALGALQEVEEALEALAGGMSYDAVSVCIEAALQEILSLTGKRASQEIVDEVFSRFCVGK